VGAACDHGAVTTDLSERYGAPSATGRRVALATAVVVVLAFAGWLAWTTLFHATPAVSSEIGGWEVVDDGTVQVTVSVALEEDVSATCTLRAYAEDHATVGEVAFEPVDGRNAVTLRTERRATSVTLIGCTAPGQPRPR
jgi:hypothetical protein